MSIDCWNKNIQFLSDKSVEELSDINFWLGNPSSLLLFDSVNTIVEDLVIILFDYEFIRLELIKVRDKYYLNFYLNKEENPRVEVDLFSNMYECKKQSFDSSFWTDRINNQDKEYLSIQKNLDNVEKLLGYPKFLRVFFTSETMYRYDTTYLEKERDGLLNWLGTFDETVLLYKTRYDYFLKTENIVESIAELLESNNYIRRV